VTEYKKDQHMPQDRQLSHSQNFLKDAGFVGSLIERTDLSPKDIVIEIGPGKGIITNQLANRVGKVIAVEYDFVLAKRLKDQNTNPKIEVVYADFLTWNLPKEDYKVFANIPFNMTADIVNKLLTTQNSPTAAYLIMQDLAAARFMGAPVSANSQASILLQPFYDMRIVQKIDRRQFDPIPNINAVLAKFVKKDEQLIDPKLQQIYRDFVIYGYNQWKPSIHDSFKEVFSGKQINIIRNKFKLGNLKPSELEVGQWIGLFDSFTNFVPEEKKVLVKGFEKRLKNKHSNMQKEHRTRRS
jgi:23S rRNA (adenine-N6)-dimethyltransferase